MSETTDDHGSQASSQAATRCGCQAQQASSSSPEQAVGTDPERKKRILHRLNRIEGQVRGLQKMVNHDRYCADVLAQMSSVQEALRATSKEILRNHLEFCATEAIRAGSPQAEQMYDELAELMHKHLR